MYCGIADIVERWVYTRQGIHKLIKTPDFPSPAFTINKGRTKVWLLADIEAYEIAHPEVADEQVKAGKQAGYVRAIRKKATGEKKGKYGTVQVPA